VERQGRMAEVARVGNFRDQLPRQVRQRRGWPPALFPQENLQGPAVFVPAQRTRGHREIHGRLRRRDAVTHRLKNRPATLDFQNLQRDLGGTRGELNDDMEFGEGERTARLEVGREIGARQAVHAGEDTVADPGPDIDKVVRQGGATPSRGAGVCRPAARHPATELQRG